MQRLPLSKVYGLIEPGPVLLLATSHKARANVMTMSWHMMMEFEPPLIGCLVSANNHSFEALYKTRECVIALPPAELAPMVVKIGNCSGRDFDKFEKFKLTPKPAENVAPPLIADCFANLECRIADTRLVDRYNFFILETVAAWIDAKRKDARTIHHRGWGKFAVDGKILKLPSRKR